MLINNTDKQYIELCKNIMVTGNDKSDRTGTGTRSDFMRTMRFDLSEGFPLLTTKRVYWRGVVGELIWFLSGSTNINWLQENKVKIWDEFADAEGSVGRMYGAQWRNYRKIEPDPEYRSYFTIEYIDQIADLIHTIKSNPNSRRMIVNAWNVGEQPDEALTPIANVEIGNPALPPCHMMLQCYVVNGKLSLSFYQRSVDIFLGLPFNIASYALLTHLLAQVTGLEVGELIWTGGDCHIYSNHMDQVNEQIRRFDRGEVYSLPKLRLNPNIKNIDDFTFDDIELLNYVSGSPIKAEVAV